MGLFLESAGTEFLAVLVVLLSAFYYYFTSTKNFWKDRGVPHIKPTFFFGNFKSSMTFRKSPAESFQDLYNSEELKGTRFAGAWSSRTPILLANDPDFIKDVLVKDFQYFSDRGLSFDEKKDPLSSHLFNLGGWRWRVLRTRLSPTFTSGKMRLMFGTMLDCTKGLEKMLEKPAQNGEIIEIKEPLAKFTTDIIGSCAFGLQFNSMGNEDSEFRKMGRKIFEPSIRTVILRIALSVAPFLTRIFNLTFTDKKITEFFLGAVEDTIDYRKKNNVSRNDMMQLLMEIQQQGPIADEEQKYVTTDLGAPKDEKGRQVLELTNPLLAAQAFVFFLAGFETSSTTMGFAFYELARNADVQEKLAEEIEKVIASHEGNLTYDAIKDMKYLDMVIAETLRKYPPVPNLFRKITKAYKIRESDVVIPAGLRVFIPIYAIHNDPKYFPEPEKFVPERFSAEAKANRHQMVYLPFGEGPRNCIGARFGLLQSKLGLITILRKFKIEVCVETPIPPKFNPKAFVMTLDGGVNVKITKRA